MGTGDFICVSMTGGAPWGFRLQGGKEQRQPLRVAKIRSQSKASGSGLCEGDEVVSINGHPCADLTHPQVVELMESVADSLHMLVKRPSGGMSEALVSDTDTRVQQHVPREGCVQSTTLQIRPAPPSQDREPRIAPAGSGAALAEDQGWGPAFPGSGKEETGPGYPETPHTPHALRGSPPDELASGEKTDAGWPGPVVELQLSLSQEVHTGAGGPVVALLGAEKSKCPDPDPNLDRSGIAHINSAPSGEKGGVCLRSSKIIQIRSGRAPRVAPGEEAGDPGLPRVEVIFDCAARQQAEGCRLPAGAGGVDSPGEGGPSEAPPSLVAFAVSSEGTEPGEEPRCGRDHSRPHRHRARHARLRRSESLSEKQVKEAKSRCRRIALLLTAAPSPHSRGVLMFKKRRRRARKFTLVSYGTGALRRPEDAGGAEDGDGDSPCEGALLGASESDGDEELLSDSDDSAQVVAFDWDSGLGDIEKKLTGGDKMEMLPDTSGKGALMFAKRRERMDQIAAQREDAAGAQADGPSAGTSYRPAETALAPAQSCVSRSYIEVSPGPGLGPQHNGFGAAPYTAEAPRVAPTNRTARPFPGSGAQPAAAFPPVRSVTSPTADFPAPPPYSAVTPPPGAPARPASIPGAAPAQPPPWPQPAPWSPERIASRDERISVPAKRTGILQEAKRRSTAKPMFTFKEPKVSPNPELLSLLQNSEGKRGGVAGGDSGPEEDYLSLGAEACNFMQSPSAKQKTPPPVAPKPAVKSSSQPVTPVTPVTPVSPVWSPSLAPTHPPAFPTAAQSQGTVASSIKIAQPSPTPARPASALSLAGPFRGPQAAVASVNYAANTAKPAAPVPAGGAGHTGAAGPSGELPGMQGKGAQLFAKRQSRMEKYVVDSDTVQAHAARAQSPTPSLPAGWKYSSNVRAPPPLAYNPILSPSYPPAAVRSQASAPQASRPSKKKGKKPLNALDVMKHQPYQLNASLFTFQPPDAKAGPPQRAPTKANSVPAMKPAPPPVAVNAGSPASLQGASAYSAPARSPPPAFFPEAASPVSASPVPRGVPGSPKPESASTSSLLAPRPKFSAKKSGVAVQESGRSLSLPGRPALPAISAAPPWAHPPACGRPAGPADGLERAGKRLTPWDVAAKSPLGLIDDAFEPRNIQEAIVANVVSAAWRKVLPGPSEGGDNWLSCVPGALEAGAGSPGGPECNAAAPRGHRALPRFQAGPPGPHARRWQPFRPEPAGMALATRSGHCLSVADGTSNPRPGGWRRQPWKAEESSTCPGHRNF
ncbi:synaptopodin-2 [Pteronotus mesoamericanus]|uniref:synaptopodin-2 n=1 Tax=Pteronotus mesoamericanus TaxID=1884717 RepID=UPI0023ED9D2E|nr:synaptopodin-2 [Pteronotus parnellii mesoamericanus]